MFKLNKANRNALTTIAVVMVVLFAIMAARSYYEPMPLVIKAKNEDSFFDLPVRAECVDESTYSTQRPGGVCGAEKLVREQADYEII
jgi:hypothetical protein